MLSTKFTAYLRQQSDWRRAKADQYPDDARNSRSADALDAFAEYIKTEIDVIDRLSLEDYGHVFEVHAGQVSAGPEVARAVSRYGYDSPVDVGTHHEFAVELQALTMEDLYNLVAASNPADTPPADERTDKYLGEVGDYYGLYPAEVAAALDGIELDRDYFTRRPKLTHDEAEQWITDTRRSDAA